MFRRLVLFFDNEPAARRYLARMTRQYPEYRKAFRMLRDALAALYQFSYRPDLRVPRTSNRIENLMGRLEQRFKTMRGVKTAETYLSYATEILKRNYQPIT